MAMIVINPGERYTSADAQNQIFEKSDSGFNLIGSGVGVFGGAPSPASGSGSGVGTFVGPPSPASGSGSASPLNIVRQNLLNYDLPLLTGGKPGTFVSNTVGPGFGQPIGGVARSTPSSSQNLLNYDVPAFPEDRGPRGVTSNTVGPGFGQPMGDLGPPSPVKLEREVPKGALSGFGGQGRGLEINPSYQNLLDYSTTPSISIGSGKGVGGGSAFSGGPLTAISMLPAGVGVPMYSAMEEPTEKISLQSREGMRLYNIYEQALDLYGQTGDTNYLVQAQQVVDQVDAGKDSGMQGPIDYALRLRDQGYILLQPDQFDTLGGGVSVRQGTTPEDLAALERARQAQVALDEQTRFRRAVDAANQRSRDYQDFLKEATTIRDGQVTRGSVSTQNPDGSITTRYADGSVVTTPPAAFVGPLSDLKKKTLLR